MERIETAPRADWQKRLEEAGIRYHSNGYDPESSDFAAHPHGGDLWWFEGAYWQLTSAEVDRIDDATSELHARCLDAVDFLVNKQPDLLREWFGLPAWFVNRLSRSWRRSDPSLIGRMDLAFDDATGSIKLLEYNADTPTLCIETAVAQWYWLRDLHPEADQFNSLHERLLERFRDLLPLMRGGAMYFAAYDNVPEESAHSAYWQYLASQAGIEAISINLPDIGWNGRNFVDLEGREIFFLQKIYPWEWAICDEFGRDLADDACLVLEPPWKALLSDKAILAVLHQMFPDHSNILPAKIGNTAAGAEGKWIVKPCLGREGENITMLRDGITVETTQGKYGGDAARWVTQAAATLSNKQGWNAIIGSWIVGHQTGGIIFRESRQTIIRDSSRVVPHLFR